MKAVVFAGGQGTRLSCAKGLQNKHALPVYDQPMISHVVQTLAASGIDDILVMLNNRHPETILEILEDGRCFGCHICYTYVREVNGPGRELCIARHYTGNEPFVVMLGDSLYLHPLNFTNIVPPHIWTMSLDGIDDPSKYGQVKVDGDRVVDIRKKQRLSSAISSRRPHGSSRPMSTLEPAPWPPRLRTKFILVIFRDSMWKKVS